MGDIELIWKVVAGIFVVAGAYYGLKWGQRQTDRDIKEGFSRLEVSINGIGGKVRNAEWERYKMHLLMMSLMEDEADRKWCAEQFLKR